MSTPTAPSGRPRRARLAGIAVLAAASCFCAVMWTVLIRAHSHGPASSSPRLDYAALLAPGEQERSAQWGIYLGPKRIGGSTMRVVRLDDDTISLTTKVHADLGPAARYIAGFEGALEVDFRAAIAPVGGLLSWQLESDALDASVLGVVRNDRMLVRGRVRGRPISTEVPYEPGALVSEAFSALPAVPSLEDLKIGQSWSASVLNPVTGDFQNVTVRITRSQGVHVGGEPVQAFELDFLGPGGHWTSWVTADGQVLVQGTPFGLTLQREDLPPEDLRALMEAPTPSAGAPR